jgi:hypothetical protein
MARSSRRHRLVARTAGLAVFLVLPLLAVVMWLAAPPEPGDHAANLAARLAADGEAVDVIDCALRLAADDLRVAPLEAALAEELVATCRTARQALAFADAGADTDETSGPVEPGRPETLGDDPSLDRLWRACEEGSGSACDRLFAEAPPGSGYETFGLSCGDRPDILNCGDLDEPATGEPAGS